MLGWELPPHNSGGLGVACYHMTQALARRGLAIDFMLPYEMENRHAPFMRLLAGQRQVGADEYMRYGAYDSQHWRVEYDRDGRPLGSGSLRDQQRQYIAGVRNHLLSESNRYDIIHAHDWLTFEAGMAAKEICGAPFVTHIHATETDRAGGNDGNPLVHDIEDAGLRESDHVIAVSDFTRQLIMRRYGVPAGKISVVHNSIDSGSLPQDGGDQTYRYLQMKKQQGYSVVISVGRLTIQKGLHYLLKAFRTAVDQHPNLLLVLAGTGEQYHELIQLAADLGLADNVLFAGFVRGKSWQDIFAIGDMFIMPSVSEPFGLVALEAAGFGNAILISRQSGAGEVLKSVLRFDYWDTDKLGNQIAAVAEYPALQNTLKANAIAEFNGFSWDHAADKIHGIYNRQGAAV